MKGLELEAYRQGFEDGINLKDGHKIQIIGYDLFEVFDVMEKHMTNKSKVKMTRAEAKSCFLKHIPQSMEGHAEDLIDFYIEAGMLEVVEESTHNYVPLGFKFPFKHYESWAECCKALNDQGWDIIKR